nr:barstar family protein [uncultured Agathobaculum sp.]
MRELLLDAESLYTRAQVHDALARAFGFSADYGGTLDALYDRLCVCPPTRLTLRHAELLVVNLGNYGELLLRVLAGAAAENPSFILHAE